MIGRAIRLKIALALAPVVLLGLCVFGLVFAAGSIFGTGTGNGLPCGASVSLAAGSGSIGWPMRQGTFTLSSPYGPRAGGFHHGQDFAAPLNTPIYAVADGVIEKAGSASGFGDWIVEKSSLAGQVIGFVYGHEYPSGLLAQEGQQVKAGDMIGLSGDNGQSTGPHMHFEVWIGGRFGGHDVDPMSWLTGTKAAPAPSAPPAAPPTAPGGGLVKASPTPSGPTGLGPGPSSSPATPSSGPQIVLTGLVPPVGQQSSVSIDAEQRQNVATIVGVVKGRGLPLRAAVLAVATAMQESSLRALHYGDRDSLGLYQQRASWGPVAVREDPAASTGLFLDRLTAFDWASRSLAEAVQTVQVSATPDAYARWEVQAEALVAQAAGVDPIAAGIGASAACTVV